MSKTMVTNESSIVINADFSMLEKFNELVASGIAKDVALKQVNETVKTVAINSVVKKNGVLWVHFIDGVIYEQLTEEGEPTFKTLKVNDIFILKANKNSTKMVIPKELYVTLEAFGVNVLESEMSALEDETLLTLKVYNRYNPALECFIEDTRTGNNSLEKQFQVFLECFYGVDNAPKARKTYIKHLKRQYVIANKNGYRNGNALALLQLVVNHAYDCKHNITYQVKSGLASHKAPKEKTAKK